MLVPNNLVHSTPVFAASNCQLLSIGVAVHVLVCDGLFALYAVILLVQTYYK